MTDVSVTLWPPCLCPSEGHKHGISIQSSIKFGDTSTNNAWMKNSRDLILREVVYITIIYRNSDSWLYSLNGYDFSFDHRSPQNAEDADCRLCRLCRPCRLNTFLLRSAHTMGLVSAAIPCNKSQGLVALCELAIFALDFEAVHTTQLVPATSRRD